MNEPWGITCVSLLWLAFLASLGTYLHNVNIYKGIESWSYVTPKTFVAYDEPHTRHIESKSSGSQMKTVWEKKVSFQYVVGGQIFNGFLMTPDGFDNSISGLMLGKRVYYKPEDPSIAVLLPVPYRGTALFWLSVFFGSLILLHIVLSIKRKWRILTRSSTQRRRGVTDGSC